MGNAKDNQDKQERVCALYVCMATAMFAAQVACWIILHERALSVTPRMHTPSPQGRMPHGRGKRTTWRHNLKTNKNIASLLQSQLQTGSGPSRKSQSRNKACREGEGREREREIGRSFSKLRKPHTRAKYDSPPTKQHHTNTIT